MPSLERFSFTPTESRVYEVLLRLGSSTGYAVSKAAGLARANTYQALDGLVRRGAARRASTIPARYAALPPEAVVAEIDRRMRRDLEALAVTLRSLPRGTAVAEAAPTAADMNEAVAAVVARITPLIRSLLAEQTRAKA